MPNPLILFTLSLTVPAAAQERPPEVPDCPAHSAPAARADGELECVCDEGYEWDERDLACVLEPCPDDASRPTGRERDPRGCVCRPGFKWDDPALRAECMPQPPCGEPGATRDSNDRCVCPDHAEGQYEEDDEGRRTLLSCACVEGYAFSPEFYTCRAIEQQLCPEHSHVVPFDDGAKDEDEDEEEGEDAGPGVRCQCDDNYEWRSQDLTCVRAVSDCGPHSFPALGGQGCECEPGFHPAPAGTRGCVGEVSIRCPPNAHNAPDPDNPEVLVCACNTGYRQILDDAGDWIACEREDAGILPNPGGDGGEDGSDVPDEPGGRGGSTGCFGSSVAAGAAGAEAVPTPAPAWLLALVAALLLRRRRRGF